VEELGYDQFLHAEARHVPELIEYGAARRAGGDYYRTLRVGLRPISDDEEPALAEDEAPIRAEAFGSPRVTVRRHQIADLEWRSASSKEMFFYLVHQKRPLRKEQIALDLWPDLDPKRLNSHFHSNLHRLRKAIPGVIVHSDGAYQVNPAFKISYDAAEFEHHTQDAERDSAGSDGWAQDLTAAVRLYRGPFAETFDSDWADDARRRYEDRYLSCLLSLAEHALRSEDWEQAIRLGESIWDIDPVNETAALCVMRAHARAGRLDGAVRAYRRLHNSMLEELAEEPSDSLQHAYRQVLSGAALDA
jgi:two-component SAPR family response regulator